MPFSLAGSLITQTGTDTNLAGLASIDGVTVLNTGGTGEGIISPKRIYRLDDRELVVEGTLFFDAKTEEISFTDTAEHSRSLKVTSGAELTISGNFNANGQTDVTAYPVGLRVNKPDVGSTWNDTENNYLIRADVGSIVNLNGVVLGAQQNVFLAGEGSIKNVVIIGRNSDIPLVQINSSQYIIDGIHTVGTHGLIFGADNDFVVQNAKVRSAAKTSQHDSTGWTTPSQVTSFLTFRDYIGAAGTQEDFIIWWNGSYKVENSSGGSALRVRLNGLISNPDIANGFLWVTKDLKTTYKDASGNPIEGVTTYVRDFDNGKRRGPHSIGLTHTSLTSKLPEFSDDLIYTSQSDALGIGSTMQVTTAVWTGSSSDETTSGQWDYRSKYNDAQDVFEIKQAHYNYLFAASSAQFTGVGILDFSNTLFVDPFITEQIKATVDAYSAIETPEKLYDRAKAYLLDNYAGETTSLVARLGDEIDAGSYNLVIDPEALTPFSFDGSTMSIRAAHFTGHIRTTAAVTLLNGATVNGSIIDNTFNSFLSFSGLVSWRVYASEAERDANTSVLATGIDNETYRFNYTEGTTYFLRLYTGPTAFMGDAITPAQSGETDVSLDTTGLLRVISNDVSLAMDHARAANMQTKHS